MWNIARRPRWIALLVLALAIAGGFAALGQWQLARGLAAGVVVERETETTGALEDYAEPQQPMRDDAGGQLVEVSGQFVDGDFMVVSDRLDEGDMGYWVIGHLRTDAPGSPSLAVGLGWTASGERAASIAEGLTAESVTLTGRYLPTEAAQLTDFEDGAFSTVATAALVNMWDADGGIYSGYLVADEPVDGLGAIHSPPPVDEVSVNWLNVFYAAEWVVFSGFAVFMWFRLVKDAWEREQEEAAEAAADGAAAADAEPAHVN